MKRTLILIFGASLALSVESCQKQVESPAVAELEAVKAEFNWSTSTPVEIANHYHNMAIVDEPIVLDSHTYYLTAQQFDSIATIIEPLGLWTRELLLENVAVGANSQAGLKPADERYRSLMAVLADARNNEVELETIARRNTGNANTNGSGVFWDASPSGLAFLLTQIGQPQGLNSTLNYARTGTSATTVTFSDVLRAANGLANTSFDNVIEIVDVVYEFQVSGDGNWLIGAVVLYNGQEYVYSNYEIPGLPNLGPLVYDPEDGGIYIVGPMPGGIVSVNVTGQWEAPVE